MIPMRVTKAQAKQKLKHIHKSASRRGYTCTLNVHNVRLLMEETQCVYTGETFGVDDRTILSFDRVDNTIGYVPGNVIPVTTYANQLKSNYDVPELLELAVKSPTRYLGFVSQVQMQMDKKQKKIETRLNQIAELERLNEKDQQAIVKLEKDMDKARASVDSSIRDAEIFQNMASVLTSNRSIGTKYMTRWQRAVLQVKILLTKVKFTLPLNTNTTA